MFSVALQQARRGGQIRIPSTALGGYAKPADRVGAGDCLR
jgi:hypothetical protein